MDYFLGWEGHHCNASYRDCTNYRSASEGSGVKIFDPGWVGSIFVAHDRLGQLLLVWVWKISPKNTKFFSFFPSDWVNKYRLVSLLFTAGQRVKSMLEFGQVSSHLYYPLKIPNLD